MVTELYHVAHITVIIMNVTDWVADIFHATHSFLSQVGAVFWKQISSEYTGKLMLIVSNVLHYFLPMLLTLTCYLSIIVKVCCGGCVNQWLCQDEAFLLCVLFVIRVLYVMTTIMSCAFVNQVLFMFQVKHNKRKLAAAQHATGVTSLRRNKCNFDTSEHATAMTPLRHSKSNPAAKQHAATAMDEATRAMLAVFLSNLFFGLPQSIYNIVYFSHRFLAYVIITSFFFTHLFVDPMVFVYFNRHHRRRVMKTLRFCLCRSPCEEFMPTHDSRAIRPSSTRMSFQ